MKLKVLNTLAETYIAAQLCDTVPEVRMGLLEMDGRKQLRAAKELAEEGLVELKPLEVGSSRNAQRVIVTAKCMEFFEAKKPNLMREVEKVRDEYDLTRAHNSDLLRFGLRFSSMPIEERKYILEHRSDYEVVVVKDSYRLRSASVAKPAAELTAADWRYAGDFYFRDSDFVRTVDEKAKNMRFDRLFKTNLPWGLTVLLGVSEETAKCFTPREDSMNLWPGPSGMRSDPEKWEGDLDRMEESVEERIADLEKRATAISQVQHLIKDKFGSMQAFVTAYRARLQEALDKQDADEEKKDAASQQ